MWRILACVALALFVGGCEAANKGPVAQDQRESGAPTTFTGTLRSGVLGIGGEHTGWILVGDGASGGIEVDVSQVRDAARENDGRRVTIGGRMSEKNYTERGKVMVLVADSIKPAQKPEVNQPAVQRVG